MSTATAPGAFNITDAYSKFITDAVDNGPWKPEGAFQARLVEWSEQPGDFKQKEGFPDLPATIIVPKYETEPPPGSIEKPRRFSGKPVVLPDDPNQVCEDSRKKFDMNLSQFKMLLSKLADPTLPATASWGERKASITDALNRGVAIMVRGQGKYSKDRKWWEEVLYERIVVR